MQKVELSDLPLEPVSHDAHVLKRVMLRNGQVKHLTNYAQSSIPAGSQTSSHAHADMTEIFLVLAGSGEAVINNQTHPIGPGSCLVIEHHDTHVFRNTGPEPLVMNYFGIVD